MRTHFDVWEAVVLAVDCGKEVHDERGHVKDVDKGYNPFEDCGCISPVVTSADDKG